jgi:hypothetical protein
MTNKEYIENNITLTFDFLRQIIDNPSILKDIPNGAVIDFLQKDLPIHETKKVKNQ